MKVILMEPYAEARGVFSRQGEYYVRMVKGKPVVQRRPHYMKPPTQKQIAARKKFAEQFSGHHR